MNYLPGAESITN